MYKLKSTIPILALLSTTINAAPYPLPQDIQVLGPGTTNTTTNTTSANNENICSLPMNDEATWSNSGAAKYLDTWLGDNGSEDWLDKLEKAATGNSSSTTSGDEDKDIQKGLDCATFEGACPAAEKECEEYKPESVWVIRNAASVAYGVLKAVHGEVEGKKVEEVMKEFNSDTVLDESKHSSTKLMERFTAAIAGVGAGASNSSSGSGNSSTTSTSGNAGVVDFVAAVLKTTDPSSFNSTGAPANTPNNSTSATDTMRLRLDAIFSAQRAAITTQLSLLFGGQGDLKELAGQTSENQEVEPIARVFAGGKFLVEEADVEGVMEGVGESVKGAWVGVLQS